MFRRSSLFPALAALLLAAALAAGCSDGPPRYSTYTNEKWGLRFNPAPGWDVAEKNEPGCRFAVEATKGPDLHFQICISPPRPEILFTQNTFVSCENLKQYVQEKLKGVKPLCNRGGIGSLFGYDVLYARLLDSDGRVRVQFVDHQFLPVPGHLLQVLAYSIGDNDNAAHELFDSNRSAIFAMTSSVRLK